MINAILQSFKNRDEYVVPSAKEVRDGQEKTSKTANAVYRQRDYNPYRDGTPGLGEVIRLKSKLDQKVQYNQNPSKPDIQCLKTFIDAVTHYPNQAAISDQLNVTAADPDIRIGKREFECAEISQALVEAFKQGGYVVNGTTISLP